MIKQFHKIKTKIVELLKQGTSPEKLALCISGSIALGLFPVLGSTTLLITLFVFLFRLNLPIAQLVNFLIYPLQIIVLIPLISIGELLFGIEKLNLSLSEMIDIIEKDFFGGINQLLNLTLQGILAWLVILPFLSLIIYIILKQTFLTLNKKINSDQSLES